MIIVGIFECGCSNEAGLSSIEVVKCDEGSASKIIGLMKKHSADFQCHQAPANTILMFPCDIHTLWHSDEERGEDEDMKTYKSYSFDEYIGAWDEDDKDEHYQTSQEVKEKIEKRRDGYDY